MGSLRFDPNFLIFGLTVYNNIAQKSMELQFDFLLGPSSSKNTYFRLSLCPSVSDSITLDMLLENDGNFGEVINGTDIRPDSMHLS